jgi:Kef-type K+ transport system, predicted NAD-binding component
MDYVWIAIAFSCGFLVKQIKFPPLIGYLAAGFGLHAIGIEADSSLKSLADVGVALLLFTIGLKLNIKSLFKTEILASAVGHMSTFIVLTFLNAMFLAYIGFSHFIELDWASAIVIGFAVSFSSTVFAVKVLEDRGEMRARHGQVTIGILIIQDITAVVFVTLATDKSPSVWAFALLFLPLLKPIIYRLLDRSGHGEILPLAGFFLAFTGSELFELVGLEAHLGALVIGALLSNHNKAIELAKSLLHFKDLFLIGFFLSIGFTALPTLDMLGVSLIIAIALPFKTVLFFLWFARLKLRARTAFLSALSLTNYSEFGLIVCSVSVTQGYIAKEWLVIMAVSVAISFILSSIININAHELYQNWNGLIKRFELPERLIEDQFSQPKNASVLVIGMGRVGTGAYDTLKNELQKNVCGIDVDKKCIEKHCRLGRNVIGADAEDPDFWSHTDLTPIHLIMFTIPNCHDAMEVVKQLRLANYQGKTAGVARYKDEEKELLAAGVDAVFNYYAKAGTGFAEQTVHLFNDEQSNK